MPATAGSQSGSAGAQTASAGTTQGSSGGAQRDTAGGQVGQSGASGASGGTTAGTTAGTAGGYSLDNLPGGLGDGGTGPMTAAEREAVLTGALNRGYEEFDGVILAERARAQAEANAARNTEIPGDEADGGGGAGAGSAGGPVIVAAPPGGAPTGPQGIPGAGGGPGAETDQTFPPPEDIPSGRDDDIVARQLREAAMREPDPVLREALWDEYRRYTGLSQ
jgi:hypothetical protein